VQPSKALSGMDVTVFGILTSLWQENINPVGIADGNIEGTLLGALEGMNEGAIDGLTVTGALEGAVEGIRVTGAVVEEATGDGVQKVKPVKQASPAAHSVLEPLGQAL
jgi:hypothetical protein